MDFEPTNFIGGTRIGSDKWYWIASGAVLNYEFNWQQSQSDNLNVTNVFASNSSSAELISFSQALQLHIHHIV